MILDDDQLLVKEILKGKKSSFEELMRRYNSKMYNFIFKMVRDEEISVELTQDFFIKLYLVLGKYNFEYKFSTWIYRICYNLVIDHLRKNKIFVDSLDSDQFSPKQTLKSTDYIGEDGFEKLAKEELQSFLWDVVESIPLKYKQLILLRYLQGLKYDEIAEITSLPVGTVKNRIFKAKELLKTEMEKNEMFN